MSRQTTKKPQASTTKRAEQEEKKKPLPRRKASNGKRRGGSTKVEEVDFNAADFPNSSVLGKNPNDFAWYNNNPEIIEDVARVPFALAEGAPFRISDYSEIPTPIEGVNWNTSTGLYNFPGIMTFDICHTLGYCKDHTDALNVAALQLFTTLRNAVSGSIKYDQNEPMMFIIASVSAIALYEHLSRGYRTACIADYQNKYLPDALLQAQGFAPSLRANRTRWKSILDYFALKLSTLNIPNKFSIISRTTWMYANIFTDSATAKAQLYLMKPASLWQWREGVDGQKTNLTAVNLTTLTGSTPAGPTFPSFEAMEKAIDALLNPLLGSGDVGEINGQLANAFGSDAMVKFKYQEADQPQSISYSKEVLSQIENATILNDSIVDMKVTQNLSDLVSGPFLQCTPHLTNHVQGCYGASGRVGMKHMLNFHWDNVTYQDVTVATRLSSMMNIDVSATASGYAELVCGTEVIQYADVWTLSPTNLNIVSHSRLNPSTVFEHETPSEVFRINAALPNSLAIMTMFDWSPIHYLISATGNIDDGPLDYELINVLADVDNYAWIGHRDLKNIHEACIISEWMLKDYPLNAD